VQEDELPDDIHELKKIIDTLRHTIDHQSGVIRDAHFQLELEREKYLMLTRRYFGSSSEKRNPSEPTGQQTFEFDEAEAHADPQAESPEPDVVPVKAHTKKKGGRKPIPATLETIEIVHDPPEEEKHCPCCGELRPSMGDECSDEYELVPAHVVRKHHVRKKYGQCSCEAFQGAAAPAVVIAPPPSKIAPKSAFSNATIAFFMASKFCDYIPFYRMSKMLERNGLEVSRATLCNLAMRVGSAIGDIIDLMWRDVRGSPVILIDETTLQVLNNAKGDSRSTCYMWVTLGYRERAPVILYHYHSTRSKIVPERSLEGFNGFLQTDGYEGYRSVGERDGIVHVGCFAHIRRKFFDAKEVGGAPGLAEEALELIGRVY
jgi:transposase